MENNAISHHLFQMLNLKYSHYETDLYFAPFGFFC